MIGAQAARDYWDGRGLALLWFSVLSGPVAWALDELISYSAVKPACFSDHRFALTAINGGALMIVVAGALVARSCMAKISGATSAGAQTIDRSYFTAVVGLGLNVLVALLILLATFPHFVLSPCE